MPDGAQHVAFAYSADGKDRFTTVYPNLNLLDGTRDFSGGWDHFWDWTDDGTYKGLAVKKQTGVWNGIRKAFTAPKDGAYTFSAYIKSSGDNANTHRYVDHWDINGIQKQDVGVNDVSMGNNFDWKRDSFTLNLKKGETVSSRYEMVSPGTLWNAGHKWEQGSTVTPWMPSLSEVTIEDFPSYIGTYTDNNPNEQSTDPEKYTWKKIE